MKKLGAPEMILTPALEESILAQVAVGVSMRAIAAQEGMPSTTTILKWLRNNAEFALQYARAKEECIEMYAEEIISIADDTEGDRDRDGRINHENIQRSKLRVDTRKWLASKLKARKYGDRIEQRHTDAEGKNLRPTQVVVYSTAEPPPDE